MSKLKIFGMGANYLATGIAFFAFLPLWFVVRIVGSLLGALSAAFVIGFMDSYKSIIDYSRK